LILSIFVKEIELIEEKVIPLENEIYLRGYLCKAPVYRTTPKGREIADVMVATDRGYGKSDYIPCIFWGRNARFVGEMEIGTYLELEGRVQSREYLKRLEDGTEEVRTAYEVSVSKVEF
jgi:single-stranded DNA-binding protein